MNVDNFKTKLQSIMGSTLLNLKLYVITKENEVKKLVISEDVSDSLIELFKTNLEDTFLDEEKSYRLKPIDESNDELANTYYYFSSANLYERLNTFSIFNESEVAEFEFSQDNFSDIETFFIKISSSEECITLYKKNYPINLLQRGKTLFFTKDNQKIDELKNDILKIDRNFQFLSIDDKVLIVNLSMLEKQLGYSEIITRDASEVLNVIASLDFLEDISKLTEMAKTTRIAKKINNIKNSKVLIIMEHDKQKVKEFIEKIEELKKSLKFNEDDKLELTTKVGVEKFLKLLDDDYLKSELTEVLYDTLSKEKILDV